MIEVTYSTGKTEVFNSANDFDLGDNEQEAVEIVKRKFDDDGEYDEDDDVIIAYIFKHQIRKIVDLEGKE